MHRLFRLALQISPIFVVLTAAACRDTDQNGPLFPSDDQHTLSAVPPSGLRDGEISQGDTYFAFDVTTVRVPDASATDDMFTMSGGDYTPNESVYIETGYGTDGQLRFNLYSSGYDNPRVPDPPALVRTVGNSVSIYDEWGGLLDAYSFNDYLEGAGLPGGDLSVGSPRGSIYDPGGGTCLVEPCSPTNVLNTTSGGTEVRQKGDDVLVITTRLSDRGATIRASGGDLQGVTVRTFRKKIVPTTDADRHQGHSSERWVIESIERTATFPTAHGPTSIRTRSTFRFSAAHINPGSDRRRDMGLKHPARRQSGVQHPPSGSVASLLNEPGIDLCKTAGGDFARTVYPGGASLVYQHGFCSGAETWSAMHERVPETHNVGVEQAYSLDPDQKIDVQTSDLEARLSAVGVGGNVVVAHSQGGLIARRLGQRRPDLVSGVVTIATPHEGALVAGNPPYIIQDQLRNAVGGICFGNVMCDLSLAVLREVDSKFINMGVSEAVPLAGDVQVGSPFLRSLNGQSAPQYESFRRASIKNIVPVRFTLFRMIGDGRSGRDRLLNEAPLAGREWVKNAHRVYDAGRVLQYLAMALRWRATDYGYGWGCYQSGYQSYWEPCYDPYSYSSRWWRADYWYQVAGVLDWIGSTAVNILDAVDYTWDQFTTNGLENSDGFIQSSSQPYPSYVGGAFTPKLLEVSTQEAHTGETASPGVLRALRIALDEVGMPRR